MGEKVTAPNNRSSLEALAPTEPEFGSQFNAGHVADAFEQLRVRETLAATQIITALANQVGHNGLLDALSNQQTEASIVELRDSSCESILPEVSAERREKILRSLSFDIPSDVTMTPGELVRIFEQQGRFNLRVIGRKIACAADRITNMEWDSSLAPAFIALGRARFVFGDGCIFTDIDYEQTLRDTIDMGVRVEFTDDVLMDINTHIPAEKHTELLCYLIDRVPQYNGRGALMYGQAATRMNGVRPADHDRILEVIMNNENIYHGVSLISVSIELLNASSLEMRERIVRTVLKHEGRLVYGEIAKYIDRLPFIDKEEFARETIETSNYTAILNNIDNFPSVNREEFFRYIMTQRPDADVLYTICKLKELDAGVVRWLLPAGERRTRAVFSNLHRFRGLDHQELLDILGDDEIGQRLLAEYASKLDVDIPAIFFAKHAIAGKDIFSEQQLGAFIKTRLLSGIDGDSLHDTSYWLHDFDIRYKAVLRRDISASGTSDLPPARELILPDVEREFLRCLLATDDATRQRLTLGGAPSEKSVAERVRELCSGDASLRKQFAAELAQRQAAITRDYYDELLTVGWVREAMELRPAMPVKKFFAELFAAHTELKAELDRRISEAREQIEAVFIEEYGDIQCEETYAGEAWFFCKPMRRAYQIAMRRDARGVPFYKSSDFTPRNFAERAADEALQDGADGDYTWLCQDTEERSLAAIIDRLETVRRNRDEYIHDARTWLMRHQTTKHSELTKAWNVRPQALAAGVPDGAAHINAWARDNEFKITLSQMAADGELVRHYHITPEEIMSNENTAVREELLRVMSGKRTIRAMAKLKKWRTERTSGLWQRLPASRDYFEATDEEGVNHTYRFEVLGKDDPRGFTIGEDTHCCMTIDGLSKSCIKAGYTREHAGFMALYRDDKLVAQSFWFVPGYEPSTLVIDNIEANKGRKLTPILDIYRKALRAIVERNDDLAISRVTIGSRYNDVDLGDLPETTPAPLLEGVYTDAAHQKLLLEIEQRHTS